mmetsp:Transcript_81195/g.161012  ORF Transcript_81195/g.161012 Transcript_81195/m.161012 type:complete len:162 (-) Transcript_81195:78-563(-)
MQTPWLLLLWTGRVLAVDVSWTSYSDRADLPMSTQWREEMKAKLAKVDTDALSPEQKKKYKVLVRKLNGESEAAPTLGLDGSTPWLLMLVGGGVVAYLWNTSSQAAPHQKLGGNTSTAASPGVGFQGTREPMSEEARAARLRRFETAGKVLGSVSGTTSLD